MKLEYTLPTLHIEVHRDQNGRHSSGEGLPRPDDPASLWSQHLVT